jgi:S-adenosylmethionine synthetase
MMRGRWVAARLEAVSWGPFEARPHEGAWAVFAGDKPIALGIATREDANLLAASWELAGRVEAQETELSRLRGQVETLETDLRTANATVARLDAKLV